MIYIDNQPVNIVPTAMSSISDEGKNLPAEEPACNVSIENYASVREALGRLGIKATYRAMQSDNFVSGSAGWRIKADGDVEFGSGEFRGTITATAGNIGGFTITATELYGGIIKTAATVGAGNTGVIMDADGLRGYDSVLGNTFNLPTDGSAPTFSSGIINETIYEISTNAILRTSATVGDGSASSAGVLINNTGLYICGANQAVAGANFKALVDGSVSIKGSVEITGGDAYDKLESNLPSDENLVGYWAFDEGKGSKAFDGSGKGNDGDLINMEDADWVDGVAGSALNFDGTNEYVNIGILGNTTNGDFSFNAWIYRDATDARKIIFGNYNGANNINIEIATNNFLRIYWNNGEKDYYGNFAIPHNEWVMLTVVRDTTADYFYVYHNGVLKNSHSEAGTNVVSTVAHYLGKDIRDGVTAFEGKMDEVRLYKDQCLTAKEIYALYKNPSGQPSLATSVTRITNGAITSKNIELAITEGQGDACLRAGKTDFGQDATEGFILGYDDSDSNKFKFELTGGHIRTSTGNDRIEISSVNNQLECYNNNVLVGKIGKVTEDGSFIFFSGAESTKTPLVIQNTGTSNVAMLQQNNSNVNCSSAIMFNSNASGGSYADTVLYIRAGSIWNGSAYVDNTASTITGLGIITKAKGCPLAIDNQQAATANKIGDIRMVSQTFQMDYGASGMFHNYNNRIWASTRNHDASSWISYKLGRYENGLVSFGNLSISGGGGSQIFTGTVTFANQFPETSNPVITAVLTSTTNLTRVSAIITATSATAFSYWVKYEASAANTGAAYLEWHISEDFNNT